MARTHGNASTYASGCRCDDCRQANTDRMREYFRARGGNPNVTWHHLTCIQCGGTWRTRNKQAKYCSNACQAAYEHGADRKPKGKPKPTRRELATAKLLRSAAGTHGKYILVAGYCALCGNAAVEGPGNVIGSVFYCSARCRLTVRRKGLHRAVSAALRRYVYERDRGICHLCRKRVAMTKVAPHPRSPVLDHLVPLSLGGKTDRANLRLAHWVCNELKGNRPANEQLMLVG